MSGGDLNSPREILPEISSMSSGSDLDSSVIPHRLTRRRLTRCLNIIRVNEDIAVSSSPSAAGTPATASVGGAGVGVTALASEPLLPLSFAEPPVAELDGSRRNQPISPVSTRSAGIGSLNVVESVIQTELPKAPLHSQSSVMSSFFDMFSHTPPGRAGDDHVHTTPPRSPSRSPMKKRDPLELLLERQEKMMTMIAETVQNQTNKMGLLQEQVDILRDMLLEVKDEVYHMPSRVYEALN
eukprot:GILI01034405.1.p2 GENE.GILI01034405.1~~GILI01034405.1.p2  ORF type:complete len:240 (+),score=57.10 GILI01034405.1:683-1402(+)